MSEFKSHEHVDEPGPISSAEVLDSLQPLPEGELRFVDRYGEPIEHTRTLIALPSGDEVYTDKPAIIWEELIPAPRLMDQAEAIVFDRAALFEALKSKNLEGDQ